RTSEELGKIRAGVFACPLRWYFRILQVPLQSACREDAVNRRLSPPTCYHAVSMKAARLVACATTLAATFAAAAADSTIFDQQGRITFMLYGPDRLAVRSRLSPGPAYNTVRVKRDGPGTSWTADGFHQTVTQDSAGAHVIVETADRATWSLQVPREEFAGGTAMAGSASAAIPLRKPGAP